MANGKIIATDLDGTLFYPRKRISMIGKKNRKFINRFLDDGGRLLLVSGRNRYFAEKVGRNLERPDEIDVVGCNGSFIISNGQLIKESFFKEEFIKGLLNDVVREFKIPLVILFTKHRNMVISKTGTKPFFSFAYRIYELCMGTYREPIVYSDRVFYEELEKGEIYKVMLFFGPAGRSKVRAREANKLLRLRYPDCEFSWVEQAIEMTPKGCSKSEGIEFYLDYNHISRDNVLVVGDSGNDISMFEAFKEESYCMEHSAPEVKRHATYLVKRFYDLQDYLYPSEERNEAPESSTQEGK